MLPAAVRDLARFLLHQIAGLAGRSRALTLSFAGARAQTTRHGD